MLFIILFKKGKKIIYKTKNNYFKIKLNYKKEKILNIYFSYLN